MVKQLRLLVGWYSQEKNNNNNKAGEIHLLPTEDLPFNPVSVFSSHCAREVMHESFNGIWGTASLWMYRPGAGFQLRAHLLPSACVILALAAQAALQFISLSDSSIPVYFPCTAR